MLIEHRGVSPTVDPSAYVAPNAVLCGDVHVGPDARILFGAVLSAEDGRVEVGRSCVVMEQAVVRGRAAHPVAIGDHVMVGPHTHVNGSTVGDGCFLATGSGVFPGSRIGAGAEVRINGIVHVNTVLEEGAVVPIGWVAVGDPAQIFAPERHDEIWAIQQTLDFVGTVYGQPRVGSKQEMLERQSEWFGAHRDDRVVDDG